MIKKIVLAFAALVVVALLAGGLFALSIWNDIQEALVPDTNQGAVDLVELANEKPEHTAVPAKLIHNIDWDALNDPPKSVRPWARWWWPGADVTKEGIASQLERLDEAGFGGFEIQPFKLGNFRVTDETIKQRLNEVDTPRLHNLLATAIEEASKRGLQIDINHWSGWPAGGPQVGLADSFQSMQFVETQISGGKKVSLTLEKPSPQISDIIFAWAEPTLLGGADFVNFAADKARLVHLAAYRVTGGERTFNPLDLSDKLDLDLASYVNLTDQVVDDAIEWIAPEGDWVLVATYQMPVGSVPVLYASETPGFVLDHMRSDLVQGHYAYVFGKRTGLDQYHGKGFRGFFNDSLEFKVNRLTRSDILDQFEKRRGYDLRPFLPALSNEAADSFYFVEVLGPRPGPAYVLSDQDERLRYDYQLTISDLIIENFVATSAKWAEDRGMVSRAQSYGMDLDAIRAFGSNTIPETEQLYAGGGDVAQRLASSAALLYGKPLVSAESFVWIHRSHATTPRKVKAAADKMFINGINHIIYHGVPYEWYGGERGDGTLGEEGWHPFSAPMPDDEGGRGMTFSSFISPNNPMWPGFVQANRYIARAQNLLQAGEQQVDVLLYYPFLGMPRSFAESKVAASETLFDGQMSDAEVRSEITHGVLSGVFKDSGPDQRVEWLERVVSLTKELDKRGIRWAWVNGHALQSGRVKSDGTYQAIVLPYVDALPVADVEKLVELQSAGKMVSIVGEAPSHVPGLYNAASRDQQVVELIRSMNATTFHDMVEGIVQGRVAFRAESKVRRMTKRVGSGEIHFFSNDQYENQSVELVVNDSGAWWYDALNGSVWPAQSGTMQLSPFESRFLIVGHPMPTTSPDVVYCQHQSIYREIKEWQVPELNDQLIDWRGDPTVAYRDKPITYTARFEVNEDRRLMLSLGLVHGLAEVSINGGATELTSLPPFELDVSRTLQQGENEIAVTVTPPMRNSMIKKGLDGVPQYNHMIGYADHLVAAGLMGPVTISQCLD